MFPFSRLKVALTTRLPQGHQVGHLENSVVQVRSVDAALLSIFARCSQVLKLHGDTSESPQ